MARMASNTDSIMYTFYDVVEPGDEIAAWREGRWSRHFNVPDELAAEFLLVTAAYAAMIERVEEYAGGGE